MNADCRADRLAAFIAATGAGVTWHLDDCSAAPATWYGLETGRAIRLPDYGSRDEAQALIEQAGSLAALWGAALAEAGGVERFGAPQLGDVAVIETRRYRQIGGICWKASILLIRKDTGGWHPFGPVRSFVKVWAID